MAVDSLKTYMYMFFYFLGGLGLMVFGLKYLTKHLEEMKEQKMGEWIGKANESVVRRIGTGVISATALRSKNGIVMFTMSLISARVVSLLEGLEVIIGANVGHGLELLLLTSILGIGQDYMKMAVPLLLGIGMGIVLLKKTKKDQFIGEILLGIGLLYVGVQFIQESLLPMENAAVFRDAFVVLSTNPLFALFSGFLAVALIQNQQVAALMLVSLSSQEMVPWKVLIFIVIGQSIGACLMPLLGSIGMKREGKRLVWLNIMYNLIGSGVFFAMSWFVVNIFAVKWGNSLTDAQSVYQVIAATAVVYAFVGFPLRHRMVSWVMKLIPENDPRNTKEPLVVLKYLVPQVMETPSFAVESAIRETVRMGELAATNLKIATDSLFLKEDIQAPDIKRRENKINQMEKMITEFLIPIYNCDLHEQEQLVIHNLFHTVNHIEHIADHAQKLMSLAVIYKNSNMEFDETVKEEFSLMATRTLQTVKFAIQARKDNNVKLVAKVEDLEEDVNGLDERFRENHIQRLTHNVYDVATGVVFLEAITHFERITDHALKMAYLIKDEAI